MNSTIRCLIASAVVILMFAVPFAWAFVLRRQVTATIQHLVRNELIAQGKVDEAAAFTFQPGVTDFGLELPPAVIDRIVLCDLLFAYWWLWLLLAIATGYGVFRFLGYWHGTARVRPADADATAV